MQLQNYSIIPYLAILWPVSVTLALLHHHSFVWLNLNGWMFATIFTFVSIPFVSILLVLQILKRSKNTDSIIEGVVLSIGAVWTVSLCVLWTLGFFFLSVP